MLSDILRQKIKVNTDNTDGNIRYSAQPQQQLQPKAYPTQI